MTTKCNPELLLLKIDASQANNVYQIQYGDQCFCLSIKEKAWLVKYPTSIALEFHRYLFGIYSNEAYQALCLICCLHALLVMVNTPLSCEVTHPICETLPESQVNASRQESRGYDPRVGLWMWLHFCSVHFTYPFHCKSDRWLCTSVASIDFNYENAW